MNTLSGLKPTRHSIHDWKKFWEHRGFSDDMKSMGIMTQDPPALKSIFHAGRYGMVVVNFATMQYEYMQGMSDLLGYSEKEFMEGGIEFLAQCVHPEDIEKLLGLSVFFYQYWDQASDERKLHLKGSANFRFKTANGQYVKILEQLAGINIDSNGKITHVIKYFTDISHFNYSNEVILGIYDESPDGNQQFYTFDLEEKKPHSSTDNDTFTKRELEILNLAATGTSSKEIATKLKISMFTVNKHRENMMRKTGSKNLNEVISFAYCNEYL